MRIIALALGSLSVSVMAEPLSDAEPYDKDLKALTCVIKKFEVRGLSPQEALFKLDLAIVETLGKDQGMIFDVTLPHEGRMLSIEMDNAPVSQIIDVIAQLSDCQWTYFTTPHVINNDVPKLRLTPAMFPNVEKVYRTEVFECTPNCAKRLGLTDSMSNREVRELLTGYGVEFSSETNALWNAHTHLLSIRNLPSENTVVAGMIRLINKGFEFTRSPAKKDAH